LVGKGNFAVSSQCPAGASNPYANHFNAVSAITKLTLWGTALRARDDEVRIKLGRIRD
jgi:hypothetical protein